MTTRNPFSRFHGRHENAGQPCHAPQCQEAGEFRAPGSRGPGYDGPGDWRWFCLEHVREFNAGYDWFEGMNAEEILSAQSPTAGWATETRAFRADAGVDGVPRWADFDDPLDAIGSRAHAIRRRAAGHGGPSAGRFSAQEQNALNILGLGSDTDLAELRRRYSQLVRKYHPDRNGGDRSHETRLQSVVEAYQLLKQAAALA